MPVYYQYESFLMVINERPSNVSPSNRDRGIRCVETEEEMTEDDENAFHDEMMRIEDKITRDRIAEALFIGSTLQCQPMSRNIEDLLPTDLTMYYKLAQAFIDGRKKWLEEHNGKE